MPGESFTTSGDGKVHSYSERGVSTDLLYRVIVSNDAYTPTGASITGGPLGIGEERSISHVLTVGSNVVLRYVRLGSICWNDFGTQCQLSLTWTLERDVLR